MCVAHRHDKLSSLDDAMELIAEDGEHHLARALAGASPIDVEPARVSRPLPMRQDVVPKGVLGTRSHMVGHDVEENSHIAPAQILRQSTKVCFSAELRIEPRGIDNVVAMHTP